MNNHNVDKKKEFVYGDNTGDPDSISMAVSTYIPFWNEEKDMETGFWEAVKFARGILERQFQKYRLLLLAQEKILAKLQETEGNVLVLDQYMPYGTCLQKTGIDFVVFPSLRGGYSDFFYNVFLSQSFSVLTGRIQH